MARRRHSEVPVIAAQPRFWACALFLKRGSNKDQSPRKPQNKEHICLGAQEEGEQGEKGGLRAIKNGIKEQA